MVPSAKIFSLYAHIYEAAYLFFQIIMIMVMHDVCYILPMFGRGRPVKVDAILFKTVLKCANECLILTYNYVQKSLARVNDRGVNDRDARNLKVGSYITRNPRMWYTRAVSEKHAGAIFLVLLILKLIKKNNCF